MLKVLVLFMYNYLYFFFKSLTRNVEYDKVETQSPMPTPLISDEFNVNRPAVKVSINNSIFVVIYRLAIR